jgi:type VII secretion integral membrane protein EccD
MTVHSGADLCRVRLVGPRTQVDLALPTTVPLADLLPSLLRMAGEELAEEGAGHGGWALQRLGEGPLDTAADLAELGLRDGDVLALRPRRDALPLADYDDVADAVDAALGQRADRWRPAAVRVVGLVAAGTLIALGALLLARSGPQWTIGGLAAATAAVVLVAAAGALSRGLGDGIAGTVVAAAALPYAFLAGALALAGSRPLAELGAAQLLLGCAAVVLAATGALAWLGDGSPVLLAALVAALAGVLGAAIDQLTQPAGAAAAVIAVLLATAPLAPALAYRLARLPLPFIPGGAEELREDADWLPSGALLDRAVQADRLLTGLTAGAAVALTACLAVDGRGPGWSGPVLALVAALVMLLRARLFTGLHQRLWLLAGGLAGVALVAVRAGAAAGTGAAGLLVPLLLAAAAALAVAMRRPGRRYGPWWPRVGDICELVAVAAVIPVALQVLGVYGYVRSLWG